MLLLKFFVYPKQDGAHRNHNQKTRQVAAYMTLKKNGKSLNRQRQIVVAVAVAVAYRRWPGTRGSNSKTFKFKNWGGFGVLDRWWLARVGRTWRFDCISGL